MMSNEFPALPRIGASVRTAADFLLEMELTTLPVDPFSIARDCGWRIHPYTRAADRMQLSLNEFRSESGAHEAFTALRRRPVIFFDDTRTCRERVIFSLCHEIGHIVLRHFDEFRHLPLTNNQLKLLDREANVFAANLLAPPAVVNAIDFSKRLRYRKIFSMSQAAWHHRLVSLESDLSALTPGQRTAQLQQFDHWMHSLRCRDCNVSFIQTDQPVCPYCSSPHVFWDPHGVSMKAMFPQQATASTVLRPHNPAARSKRMLTADLDNPMISEP